MAVDAQISTDEVRASLARIVRSAAFIRSPQLIKFIQFVADASLSGTAKKIKAYTIGVDVFGRSKDFDPQLDPIVRIEARRLRRAIENYYAGPGADDPIRVEIPLGSYAPVFYRKTTYGNEVRKLSHARFINPLLIFSGKNARAFFAFIATLCFAFLASYLLLNQHGNAEALRSPTKIDVQETSSLHNNGMPTLFLNLETDAITRNASSGISVRLRNDLLNVFSRFDAINIATAPIEPVAPNDASDSHAHHSYEEFVLNSDVASESGGVVEITFRLEDVVRQKVIWSREFKDNSETSNSKHPLTEIAATVGAELLQPYGVIRAYEARELNDGAIFDPRYACLLETFNAFRTFDKSQLANAKECLVRITSSNDEFAVGLPYLATVYNREFLFGNDGAAGRAKIMDLALKAARSGVELHPSNARAYQALFAILFNRKDVKAAFEAGARALELNPFDPNISMEFGGRLILNGNIDRGLEMTLKSFEQRPVNPAWYHYFVFLGDFIKGNLVEAKSNSDQLPADCVFRYFSQGLMAIADKNYNLASEKLDHLAKIQPRFAKNPHAWLTMFFTDQSMVDRLVNILSNFKTVNVLTGPH